MAYAVFNAALEDGRHAMASYAWRDEVEQVAWPQGGPYQSARLELAPYSRRTWTWPQGLTDDQLAEWLDFFDALDWQVGAFLLRDPRDGRRQLSLGVGDGGTVLFAMPTAEADPDFRFFPLAATADVLVGGAPQQPLSVDTDGRTVTLAAPPGLGVAVVLRYDPLRLVRLVEPVDLESADPAYVRYSLRLEELVRDA